MNEVTLCNTTLAYLKVEQIESLEQKTRPAQICKTNLQTAVDMVLKENHYFSFSKYYISLDTALEATYRDWSFLYPLPDGYLKPVEMINLQNEDWEVVGEGIACNQEPLEMVYVKRIEDISSLPEDFALAVAYRLAMLIGPLIAPTDPTDLQMAASFYAQYYKVAADSDGAMTRLSVRGEETLTE